jgi:PucR C-terminal helix-turn-helix domain
MQTARAFGLTGVRAFGDLGLLPAIVADADVGETVWRRYLQPLSGDESGRETVTALRTYFARAMHVDRAAAELTLHPNTLRNRIARFAELTGADLRDASVAMQVWWALQVCSSGHVPDAGGRPLAGRDWPPVPLAEVGAAYHTAEPHRHAADLEQAEFVRGLLWGTLSATERDHFAGVHMINVDRDYFAVRARPAQGRTIKDLARAHGLGGRSEGGGLAAVVDGDLVGFVTVPPRGPVPGVSGLGPARPLRLLHESFRMASRALHVADLRGMTGVCEFDQLGLLPAILADEAIGNMLCRRYVTPLGNTEFAAEIVETLRVYLLQGMHVPRTAADLCVHPNTVRYRITKFEELTGVAFRSNRTAAFEVLWALDYRATPAHEERAPNHLRPAATAGRINGATVGQRGNG